MMKVTNNKLILFVLKPVNNFLFNEKNKIKNATLDEKQDLKTGKYDFKTE
jgi:hypothetical protein